MVGAPYNSNYPEIPMQSLRGMEIRATYSKADRRRNGNLGDFYTLSDSTDYQSPTVTDRIRNAEHCGREALLGDVVRFIKSLKTRQRIALPSGGQCSNHPRRCQVRHRCRLVNSRARK